MIEFSKLRENGYFSVPLWEIKPVDNDELKLKYCLDLFQGGYRKSLVFKKISDNSCMDTYTHSVFVLNENKMYNEEMDLFFYAAYLNNSLNVEAVDKNLVEKYFEDAKTMSKGKTMAMIK